MPTLKSVILRTWFHIDTFISLVVLAILLAYTFGRLFVAPYPGFYLDANNGLIDDIDVDQPINSTQRLEVGDRVERIGSLTFEEFAADRHLNFFTGVQAGETIEIQVNRDGESITVPWVYPGFNEPQFVSRFLNLHWLAFIFWAIGISTQLFMRPKNTRWRLFVASNYLLGLFIIFGTVSSYRVMNATTLLHIAAWLLLPVHIHFHWLFPTPFKWTPRWLVLILYIACLGIAAAEVLELVPGNYYLFAVMLAFGGSIILLILHFILQPAHRQDVGLLAMAAFLALFPVIIISLIYSTGKAPNTAPLVLLFLPILPTAYFYVLYRRNLGGLELRANRAISLYVFLVLLGIVLLLNVGFLGIADISRDVIVFGSVIIALGAALLGIQFFPAFQALIERRLLRIKLPAQNMVENYAARIVKSTSLYGLLKLLAEDVFPSLLIRQYVFVQIMDSSARIMLAREVDQDQVGEDAIVEFLASAPMGQLIPLSTSDAQPFGWVRLMLPLKIGSEWIGAWLLGRRDPDDYYPQAELPILGSLANQTAIALSNVIQTERLKFMYEANINRYEQERLRLGHELHDSLLNEMGAMLMKHDPDVLPREFQESFGGLIMRLREIVTDLRPPMLTYGLKYALDGLADNLSERTHDVVEIVSEIQSDEDCRYPELVEHNVYRIAQEACENALKYSHANAIRIMGELSPGRIDIQVVDDGIGFKDDVSLLLDEMVTNKHYGLANMHERAGLIGAEINIKSKPAEGTQIRVVWQSQAS